MNTHESMSAQTSVRAYRPALDGLRIVAFGLVALYHLTTIEARYGDGSLLSPRLLLGVSGVDIFFVLSGFMMGQLFIGQSATRRPTPLRFLIDRASRLFPLYWAVSLALLAVWLIQPDLVFGSRSETPDLIRSFLLWPANTPPLHAVGWTLVHLAFFYLVSAALLALPRRWLWPALGIWAGFTLVLYAVGAGQWTAETRLISHPLGLEYILGLALALLPAPSPVRARLLAILAGIIMLIVAVGAALIDQDLRGLAPLQRVALLAPGPALLIYALNAWTHSQPSSRWFSLAGVARAGFALYLTHILVMSVIGRIWSPFALPGLLDNMLMIPVMLIASLVAAMLTERLFETPLAKLIRQIGPSR